MALTPQIPPAIIYIANGTAFCQHIFFFFFMKVHLLFFSISFLISFLTLTMKYTAKKMSNATRNKPKTILSASCENNALIPTYPMSAKSDMQSKHARMSAGYLIQGDIFLLLAVSKSSSPKISAIISKSMSTVSSPFS